MRVAALSAGENGGLHAAGYNACSYSLFQHRGQRRASARPHSFTVASTAGPYTSARCLSWQERVSDDDYDDDDDSQRMRVSAEPHTHLRPAPLPHVSHAPRNADGTAHVRSIWHRPLIGCTTRMRTSSPVILREPQKGSEIFSHIWLFYIHVFPQTASEFTTTSLHKGFKIIPVQFLFRKILSLLLFQWRRYSPKQSCSHRSWINRTDSNWVARRDSHVSPSIRGRSDPNYEPCCFPVLP